MLNGESDAGFGDRKAIHRQPVERHHRVLLFVASPGNVSAALAAAVEREFEWISVQIVPDLTAACAAFSAPVQLILVDDAHINDLVARCREVEQAHPAASIAITVNDCAMCLEAHHKAAGRTIRGIVPMDVNLDIWLSVIRIMLKGGEYFPPQLFNRDATKSPPFSDDAPRREAKPAESRPAVKGLTAREQQVLCCVAKGLQNKLIAAELELSEHTVKIHIHNIIRKLGAHNRTEAAALYFRRTAEAEVLPSSSEVPV